MKSMNLKMGFVVAAAAAMLLGAGCLDQQAEPSDSETASAVEQATSLTAEKPGDEVGIRASASFYGTCTSPAVTFEPGTGVVTYGFGKECRRRDGSWYPYPQTWRGRCYGDLTNCNGIIRCGC